MLCFGATGTTTPSSEVRDMPPIETLARDQSTDTRPVPPSGLKRRSVVLMIVLTIVSFGLYYPMWFLRRRAA
jgi:hypothetical protein